MNKRIKTVFTNRELARIWMSQTQEHGKNSSSSMYFRGSTIYSYGAHYPIAKIYEDQKVVLVNNHNYSPTTCGHRSDVVNAIPRTYTTKYVSDPTDLNESIDELSYELLESYYNMFTRTAASVTPHDTDRWSDEFGEQSVLLNNLCDLFKLPKYKVTFTDLQLELLDEKQELLKQRALEIYNRPENVAKRAHAKEVREPREQARKVRLDEQLEKFRQGKIDHVRNWHDYQILRIESDEVLTSGGARVPLDEAKALLKSIMAGTAKVGDKVGPYEFEDFENDVITIGCHDIKLQDAIQTLNQKGA